MTFIPVPNGVQLCFLFTSAAQKWQFCLTLRKSTGAPTDTDLQTAADDGQAWWTNTLKAKIAQDTTLSEVVATDLTAQGAPQKRNVVGTAGSAAESSPPLNVAMCVGLRTAKRGRSYRGRVYLSGLRLSKVESINTYNAAETAALIGAFVTLAATLDGHAFDVVVASKSHNKVVSNPAEVNEVTTFVGDYLLDSQRRRLTGRGT